jgi:hypothetical protein
MNWPERLSYFAFGNFCTNDFYMDLPMFHSMLLTHRDTLKVIYMVYLSDTGR